MKIENNLCLSDEEENHIENMIHVVQCVTEEDMSFANRFQTVHLVILLVSLK